MMDLRPSLLCREPSAATNKALTALPPAWMDFTGHGVGDKAGAEAQRGSPKDGNPDSAVASYWAVIVQELTPFSFSTFALH